MRRASIDMDQKAHFSVNTRLTRLLGETYRSSEVALKELVDNAWDADASNVWISLPSMFTTEPVVVRDDGSGMTASEMRGEYLNIAGDKRARAGERTPLHKRRVKGRKGIGKFAGLALAGRMQVETVARGRRCSLVIDKKELTENGADLETVPLSFAEVPSPEGAKGTTVTLLGLDCRMNFPTPERLREVLIYEYGREDGFKVRVNGVPLSVEDVPGKTERISDTLPAAGPVALHFTVASGKKSPRLPGIILKVNGKAVGRPQLFGLEEDEEIPAKLVRKVYGEVELTDLEDLVTADWGSMVENSKAFQEIRAFVADKVKKELKAAHAREMNLQKARLQKRINERLQQLPENRRQFARDALDRILKRFYQESEERIAVIADVALDAMEHDAYWAVLEAIGASSRGDVHSFAESLERFGLIELSTMGQQATRRLSFLDYLDQLVGKPDTLEKDAHKALEKSLWVLGRDYSVMSSNSTLKRVVETYCDTRFKGSRAAKRPDLLLSQGFAGAYLLIEFKRPSHPITRDDVAQAEKYRDDLSAQLPSNASIDIMMVGKGRVASLDVRNLPPNVTIQSYSAVISSARSELEWLIETLGKG